MEEIVSKPQIEINIHRGANQIGGCITEIATAQSRIIIDLGSNLPGSKVKELVVKVLCSKGSSFAAFVIRGKSD